MKLCTAIITFNTSAYLVRQFDLFQKYIGSYITVVDNSNNQNAAIEIQSICEKYGRQYIKLNNNEGDASRSHALALNEAYWLLNIPYDVLMLADHDIFPVNYFNVTDFMKDLVIAGVPQIRGDITYLWAGLVMINNLKVDKKLVKFDTQEGLDTGGKLHRLLKTLPESAYKFLDEFQKKTPEGYEYSMIADKFIHLINGSNWKKDEKHEERINAIFKQITYS